MQRDLQHHHNAIKVKTTLLVRPLKRQLARRSTQIKELKFLGVDLKDSVGLERFLLSIEISVSKSAACTKLRLLAKKKSITLNFSVCSIRLNHTGAKLSGIESTVTTVPKDYVKLFLKL